MSARRPDPRLADVFLAVGVLLALSAVVLANVLAWRHHARLDWTSTGVYTLSPTTEELLAGLDREVTAVAVLTPEHRLYEPVRDLLERYAAASPRFRLRWVDPEREPLRARELMETSGTGPGSVVFLLGWEEAAEPTGPGGPPRRVVDVEALAELDVSAFERGESPRITAFHGEDAFTGALVGLLQGRRPRVLFTTGHGELSLDDTGSGGLAGARELFGSGNVDLEEWAPLSAEQVPAGTDLVVIAGPRGPFTDGELRLLGEYLGQGGRLLAMLEPPETGGGDGEDPLSVWLADYGVELPPGTVADPSAVPQGFSAETFYADRVRRHPATAELAAAGGAVLFRTARVVRAGEAPPGASVRELVAASDQAFRVVGAEPLVDGLPGGLSLLVVVERLTLDGPGAGASEGAPTGDGGPVTNGDEPPATRLVVVGDADFATSAFLLSGPANAGLLYGLFDWLVEPATSLGIEPSRPEQVRLTMPPADFRAARLLVLVLMPLAAVVLGLAVRWRRRRP